MLTLIRVLYHFNTSFTAKSGTYTRRLEPLLANPNLKASVTVLKCRFCFSPLSAVRASISCAGNRRADVLGLRHGISNARNTPGKIASHPICKAPFSSKRPGPKSGANIRYNHLTCSLKSSQPLPGARTTPKTLS